MSFSLVARGGVRGMGGLPIRSTAPVNWPEMQANRG